MTAAQTPGIEALLARVRERLEREQQWKIFGRESNVRCLDCDLRYGERDQYGCHESGRGHSFDDEELAEARRAQPDDIDRDLKALLDLSAAVREAEQRAWRDFREWVTEECPHEPDEHAEGTCDLCDWTFAIEAELDDRADRIAVDATRTDEADEATKEDR